MGLTLKNPATPIQSPSDRLPRAIFPSDTANIRSLVVTSDWRATTSMRPQNSSSASCSSAVYECPAVSTSTSGSAASADDHDAGTVTLTLGELLHPLALHAWMM